MGDSNSSIFPPVSAKEYLTSSLAGLTDSAKSRPFRDPVDISGFVDVCERASPQDAADLLNSALLKDGKIVATEYLGRRLAAVQPGSVNDSKEESFKLYRKPAVSEATSYASTKRKPGRGKPKDTWRKNGLSVPVKNELSNPVKQGKLCHCQARKHQLLSNCPYCGKIICEQEDFGRSNYCGTEPIPAARLEMSEAEAKTNVFKDRLLGYDQNGHRQTTVVDGQSNVSVGISAVNDQFQNIRIKSNPRIKERPAYVGTGKQIQSSHNKMTESPKVISGRVRHDKQLGASCFQPLAGSIRSQKSFTPAEDGIARYLSPDSQSLAGRAELHKGHTPVADDRSRHSLLQTEKQVYHEASSSAFDICMPKKKAESKDKPIKLSPSLLVQNREKKKELDRNQKPVFQYLMPGMVLFKNWLSQNDQINIVKTCRTLGLGPGGFYQPGYGDSNKLHLWMMCLGKNWDPVSKSYEDIRSYDNAVPPPLPAEFVALVKRAVGESQDEIRNDRTLITTDIQRDLPMMNPDICLVNFYKQTGKLGMHQDKDESRNSINKGLPVVSFSVGFSAEFVYGTERGEEKANTIILDSGDVLIFGGPSRLIYHGITRVIPDTSPRWLTDQTDLCPGRINLTFRQL